jgi:predicted house-cleaning noncanonical NTP pyrophosphatase (MazG superfamily)
VTEFDKLVRDRMPEIIRADGRTPVVEVLDDEAYRAALLAKLVEETAELAAATDDEAWAEELADVLEVVRSLAEETGTTLQDILRRADDKARERGRFALRLRLVRVRDGIDGAL